MCGHERFFCRSKLDELKWVYSVRLFCGLSKCFLVDGRLKLFGIPDMPLFGSLF